MNVQIVAATIALAGVAISLLANLYLTKFSSNKDELKLKTSLIQNYNLAIIKKRIKCYPLFHYLTSEMSKTLKSGDMKIGRNAITLESIRKFREELDELDSKYGIIFSIEASTSCRELRKYVYKVIQLKQLENDWLFSESDISILHNMVQHFELCLKKDLGILIVEFNDANNKLKIKTYAELIQKLELNN